MIYSRKGVDCPEWMKKNPLLLLMIMIRPG